MAKPIGHLIAYSEGHFVDGENYERTVVKVRNRDRWNDLVKLNKFTIRQLSCGHLTKEYYQAIDLEGKVVIEGCDLPTTLKMAHNNALHTDGNSAALHCRR
ncbi:MAG: hypothetical protein JKX75_06960 [Gammaproteobacteria bacterium]|nr:hypothetical protein [Gammaproteobacteria bacterium]